MARILIVEDQKSAAAEMSDALMRMGHIVVGPALTAMEALRLAEDDKVDVAIVNLALKGDRDGASLAGHLREVAQIKILFVTARADPETVRRASAVRPHGYIMRPVTDDAIFAALSVALTDERKAALPVDLAALSEESHSWTRLPASTMSRVEDFIRKNFDSEITLRMLAEIAGMSESSFSRRFKISAGITPYQYVMRERLEEAKRLLRDTEWSLVDIAVATGFSSQSHFATTFKKSVKLTPLQYRRL